MCGAVEACDEAGEGGELTQACRAGESLDLNPGLEFVCCEVGAGLSPLLSVEIGWLLLIGLLESNLILVTKLREMLDGPEVEHGWPEVVYNGPEVLHGGTDVVGGGPEDVHGKFVDSSEVDKVLIARDLQ